MLLVACGSAFLFAGQPSRLPLRCDPTSFPVPQIPPIPAALRRPLPSRRRFSLRLALLLPVLPLLRRWQTSPAGRPPRRRRPRGHGFFRSCRSRSTVIRWWLCRFRPPTDRPLLGLHPPPTPGRRRFHLRGCLHRDPGISTRVASLRSSVTVREGCCVPLGQSAERRANKPVRGRSRELAHRSR